MAVILGLNCYKHDAAAALLIDGKLVAAAEEERFRRIKHYANYPEKAVDYVLESASISPSEIDHIAFYMLPGLVMRENICYSRNYLLKNGGFYFLLSQLNGARKMRAINTILSDHLGSSLKARVNFVEHHIAHADAACYCSGFESAAVLTMDGVGERDTSILASFTPAGMEIHSSSRFPNSPGIYYSAVTKHLGFIPDNDEYKIMGLSSYGEPEFLEIFRRIISSSKGRIYLNTRLLDIHMGVHTSSFGAEVQKIIGPPRIPGTLITSLHRNIACSAQKALEEVGLSLVGYLSEVSGLDRLVISGGVGLNCVMNGLIEKKSGFNETYPLPAAHDAGTSIGAAVYIHRKNYPEITLVPPSSMYLGPEFPEEEIREALEMARIGWSRPDNPADRTAELIEQGKVVGLFNGRMEFGPRALGNRSILADARRADMKDIVNRVVKHRESFRPFCPSCLEQKAHEYFEGCTIARYMNKTYPVLPDKISDIPSVTHVDGTARVQTVTREINPFYYDVIESFYRRTGVPVILNTSFNVKGEPIVTTPVDAIRCFYGTGIDALVMPPFLIEKEPGERN
ncbi:MAG: carbamoyltransferase [Candidatus Aegiribacteria sp.]|nr:carbamoyltransferase [Candidatus Aegiribacteria sp.]